MEDKFDNGWKKENIKELAYVRRWLDDVVFHHESNQTSLESL